MNKPIAERYKPHFLRENSFSLYVSKTILDLPQDSTSSQPVLVMQISLHLLGCGDLRFPSHISTCLHVGNNAMWM
jgi:hypothetical protein